MIGLATIGGFAIAVNRTGASLGAATSPAWGPLAAAFAISALVQPLRALVWSFMLGQRMCFRSIFAASAVGSFLDTILPGRLGEASKVAVLRVASGGGTRWPGAARAGGSLITTLLLEAVAFALFGAVAAPFLSIPGWAKLAIVGSCLMALAGIVALSVLHRTIGPRLPRVLAGLVSGAAAPLPALLRGGAVMLATWFARWFALLFVLHAYGVHVGLGGALIYMIVTGLANVAPLLPGNAGVYQGAAVGVLAVLNHAGSGAVAVSLAAPVVGSLATAAAALIALALFGRRFREISRAAIRRPAHAAA